MSAYYPPLPPTLVAVIKLARQDEGYMEESPYPEEFKALFRQGEQSESSVAENPTSDDLIKALWKLYRDMETSRERFSSEDNTELMAYYRTAPQQMGRILDLIERAKSLKYVEEFQLTVLQIVDKLEPAVRTQFVEALNKVEV